MISEAAHAECVRLLELLTNPRVQESWSWVFMTPVNIPGYEKFVKKPMDLGTIKKNLGSKPSRCRFKSHEKFARDVRLVFNNALVYNKDDQDVKGSVYAAAQHLLRVFETAYAKAIESVFKADDAAVAAAKAAHREAKEEKRKAEGEGGTLKGAEAPSSSSSQHQHRSHSSHHSSSSSHHHREGGEEGKHRHKHKKDKDKKAKKSKKKSKDRDKEHRHSSSSSDKKKTHRSSEHASGTVSSSSAIPAKEATSYAVVERAAATNNSTPTTSVPVPVASTSNIVIRAPESTETGTKMSDSEVTACLSLLMKLIKYKEGNISPAAPFLQPVDLSHFPDYRVKVPHRMHLYGVQKKLRSGSYATMDAFAYDMRLIFSNCLVYNSDVILSKVMRNHAVILMKLFESQFAKIGGTWPGIPERWKCHQIIHDILAHRTDGQETAQWFKFPVESYYDSPDQIPYGYYDTVKEPMDIGTVSSRLHLGEYKRTSEFIAGMKLVFDNCIRYWKLDPQGQTYCDSAETLQRVLHTQSAAILSTSGGSSTISKEKQRVPSSSSKPKSGSSSTQPSVAPVTSTSVTEREKVKKKSSKSSKLSKSSKSARESGGALPEKEICLGIMKLLRAHKMKGFRGIEIKTAGPFLTAVDTTKYPDYLKIVSEPMDFAKIERKLKSDRYGSVDEFSADVHLIFSNCHKYNSDPVEGADIRAMATNLRNYFAELCNEKLGPLDGMVGPSQTPAHAATVADALPAPVSTLVTKPKTTIPARGSEPKAHSATVLVTGSASARNQVKKSPAPSPTKRTSSVSSSAVASTAVTSVRGFKSTSDLASSAKLLNVESASASTGTSTIQTKPVAAQMKPMTTSASVVSSSGVNKDISPTIATNEVMLSPEELKRLKKEKREKKKKDKKEKKKKKDKKREKKDKKERSKSSSSGTQEAGSVASRTNSTPLTAAATASTAHTSVSVPITKTRPPVPVAPTTAPAPISSKRGMVEPNLASTSSGKKSKKHKKSDLTSWESTCDRVLNRLGKIEQVGKLHFNHPLLEVFPQLTAEYTRLISEPMDLRTLREQLHAHMLTPAEFIRKGRLIFQNAVKFNCADDPASIQVREMSGHLMWYFDSLCAELQLFPTPEVSTEQGRTKREQLRRERTEFVATVPVELKAKECQKLLRVLNSQKHDKNCWPFRKPVRMLFPGLSPDYFDIITTPMDLSTIAEKLNEFEYKVHGEFIQDVRLTFENAMIYNRADKEREGWSVYSAAVLMLAVVDDLWGDVTLEVMEKFRRRELLRKERMSEAKRKRADGSEVGGEREKKVHKHHHHSTADGESGHRHHHHHKSSKQRAGEGAAAASSTPAASPATSTTSATTPVTAASATSVVGTIVVGGSGSRDDTGNDATATRVKLQLMPSRPNMERMNKSERKAEEKRRKRARREEEIARSEKRRRTAVAATDDALREAELRSRRKLQKQEMAEAVHLREQRELRAAKEEAERVRRAQMKLNAAAWTGVLLPAAATATAAGKTTSFWSKKRAKLHIPATFQPPAINA